MSNKTYTTPYRDKTSPYNGGDPFTTPKVNIFGDKAVVFTSKESAYSDMIFKDYGYLILDSFSLLLADNGDRIII